MFALLGSPLHFLLYTCTYVFGPIEGDSSCRDIELSASSNSDIPCFFLHNDNSCIVMGGCAFVTIFHGSFDPYGRHRVHACRSR
ncbi:uncharacterized protein EV422DRAFT_413823 [Fimicolochytrium jonesii]|uniref:uncharacterized protein n=1 Tax=Fimicolochytrium jonesii TaxID=1396493 RepID=UPI0022FE11A4|nr:uncharacterized protein EV422DRAFT_413823 [Fimicolochytrium jonesii]KAI8822023.1 hypothetical protein EV422DRAFT_413823 [Fimicolochytrium jonesii]